MLKIGMADYGMNQWYGGFYDYEQRMHDIKALGFDGLERLSSNDAADALQKASILAKIGQKLEWEEVEMTAEERREPLDETWVFMYEDFREGKPYPILHEQTLKVMEVISKIKEIMAQKTK